MAGYKARPLADRFWEKVSKTKYCWEWTAFKFKNGYGSISIARSVNDYAHRVSWRLHYGEIPEGISVLHKCDNRSCIRPDHLFLGTQQDNMDDMWTKGRGAIGDRHGLRLHPEALKRGESNARSKLTVSDIKEIKRALLLGVSQNKIGLAFGVSQTCVGAISLGRTWSQV